MSVGCCDAISVGLPHDNILMCVLCIDLSILIIVLWQECVVLVCGKLVQDDIQIFLLRCDATFLFALLVEIS